MNVPGGGKNDIPNRLKRQFAIFYVPPPSAAAVNSIFGALVKVLITPMFTDFCFADVTGLDLAAKLTNLKWILYSNLASEYSQTSVIASQKCNLRLPFHVPLLSFTPLWIFA